MPEQDYIDRILYFKIGDIYLFCYFVTLLVLYFLANIAVGVIIEIKRRG